MRILDEEKVGAPTRLAELQREQQQIEEMRMRAPEMADLRDY